MIAPHGYPGAHFFDRTGSLANGPELKSAEYSSAKVRQQGIQFLKPTRSHSHLKQAMRRTRPPASFAAACQKTPCPFEKRGIRKIVLTYPDNAVAGYYKSLDWIVL